MVHDVVEVYTHWQMGRTERQIAQSLGLARNTVAKYLAPAKACGLTPEHDLGRDEWVALAAGWFPNVADTKALNLTWPQFEAEREWITSQLQAGVKVSVVWQRLRDEGKVDASESSLRRWVKANLPDLSPAGRLVTGLIPPTGPGEVAQVDYGFMGRWKDWLADKTLNVNAFVMTLPFSKLPFVFPVTRMDQASWSQAHVAAFEFYGGVVERLVIDNLKTGVVKANLFDPVVNRAYQELADYYGVLVDPARVRSPRDKAHVERMVQFVRESWWKGQEFTSLEAMRADAEAWCRQVAGQRVPRVLGGRTVNEVFDTLERPALRPLPPRRFEVATWVQGKVGRDCHVHVQGCLYSVPFRLVGQTVDARVTGSVVEFYADGQPVKTHPAGRKTGRVTDVADYPPQHTAFLTRDVTWCRRKAEQIGPFTSQVVDALMEPYALHKLRSCQGIVHLADKHGAEAVEQAAERAVAVGDATYRTIKGLVNSPNLFQPRPDGDGGAGAILRGREAFIQDQLGVGADDGE